MFGDKKIKIKDSERSLISETVSIEGTINSSGAIDVAGLIKGPVYSKELIVRDTGSITGTIEADVVEMFASGPGRVNKQNRHNRDQKRVHKENRDRGPAKPHPHPRNFLQGPPRAPQGPRALPTHPTPPPLPDPLSPNPYP